LVIFKKIPNWSDIASVYAIEVFIVYGWTIYWFIWKLSSWVYYLNYKEILVIGAYSAVVNLFESLLLLFVQLAITVLLPRPWFSDRFVSTGGLISVLLGGYFIYFSSLSEEAGSFSYTPLIQAVIFFGGAIGLSILISRVRVVSSLIASFADRAKIFLYLSLPISALSVFVVIVRNLVK